jgi:hypothetical protein
MYINHHNTQNPPDAADIASGSVHITIPVAEQLLMIVQAMAGDNYPLQWRIIRQAQKLFEHYLSWEDIRFILLMDTVCELRDEIRKSRGTSNLVDDHH